ncbi:ABC transporter substrate-binding protein [Cohnella caldifontis]|uniref:ABC transporter substrate-binding protein n=1 Tax=Cohnella caldifontis TaxID=3027471 RepID=UPI0023ED40FE|nr:extracellular solute-binding protein [Cohnella sp. YIM B05605]
MTAKIRSVLLVLLLIGVYLYVERDRGISGASAETEASVLQGERSDEPGTGAEKTELTIWSSLPLSEYDISQYEAANPGIEVELNVMDNETQLVERSLDNLADGTAPDILVLSHRMLGTFNTIEKLADLSSPPFSIAENLRNDVGDYVWNIHHSLDGRRLIAVPYEIHPNVLYYRADLLQEAGFPTDPNELAEYLEAPGNWLKLTKEMSRRGVATTEWTNDAVRTIGGGQFLFDRKLNFMRSNDKYKQAIEAAAVSKPSSANVTIWNSNGQDQLKQGKLGMVMLPDWGEGTLAGWLPEQSGKWRATALPFGARAIDYGSSRSFAVSLQSRHKEAAAKFLNGILHSSGSMNWLRASKESVFLGGQDSAALYQRLIREQPAEAVPTPLDDTAFEIWSTTLEYAINKGMSAEDTLDAVQRQISDRLTVKQRQLVDYNDRYK